MTRAGHLSILLIAGIAFVQCGCSGIERRLKLASLYRNHEWFELRNLVSPDTPALYDATLAYAFHDFPAAEHIARQLIAHGSSDAADARRLLCELYSREGHYAKALAEWQAARDAGVNLSGIEYLQAAGRYPDLEVVDRQASVLQSTSKEGRFLVPVTVNGTRRILILTAIAVIGRQHRKPPQMHQSRSGDGGCGGDSVEIPACQSFSLS